MINTYFPAAGYFGSTADTALTIPVGMGQLRAIRIYAPGDTVLNFDHLAILDGAGVDIVGRTSFATQSSCYEDNPALCGAGRLQQGYYFHSQRQVEPWVFFAFSAPEHVSAICIRNRGDEWGARSEVIRASFTSNLNDWELTYDNLGAREVRHRFYQLWMELSLNGFQPKCGMIGALRDYIRGRECDAPLSDPKESFFDVIRDALDRAPSRAALFCSYVPYLIRRSADSDQITARLLGYYAGSFHDPRSVNAYEWSRQIRGKNTAAFLEAIRNAQYQIFGRDAKFLLGKHGIMNAGLLRQRRNDYLAALDNVVGLLTTHGLRSTVCYGTLLGFIREGDFIDHDDDVDLLVFLDASSSEEMEGKWNAVLKKIRTADCRVERAPGTLNCHLVFMDGITIDIFPSYVHENQVCLYMEKMLFRKLPDDIFFPTKSATIFGRVFPVPAVPEAFLAERYGHDWRIPNAHFETTFA